MAQSQIGDTYGEVNQGKCTWLCHDFK